MTGTQGKTLTLVALGCVALAGGVAADPTQEPAGAAAPPAAEAKTAPVVSAGAERKGQDSIKPPTDWAKTLPVSPAGAEAAKYQVKRLEAALQVKRAELHRAEAGRELADALVGINERLESRLPGSVSSDQKAKAEGERKIKAAEVESAKAQVAWAEAQLEWAKGGQAAPGLIFTGDLAWPPAVAGGPPGVEERLAEIERKLERVLKLLEAPRRPDGLLGP